jgi:hypothetical protein
MQTLEDSIDGGAQQIRFDLEGLSKEETTTYFKNRFQKEKKLIPKQTFIDIYGYNSKTSTITGTYFYGIIVPIINAYLEKNREQLFTATEISDELKLGDWDTLVKIMLSKYSKQRDNNLLCVIVNGRNSYKLSKSCSEAKMEQRAGWREKGFCYEEQCGTNNCPKTPKDEEE